MIWDHERETGVESPFRLTLEEGGESRLVATGPTAEDAVLSALCLLEIAHARAGRSDSYTLGVSRAVTLLNDACIAYWESGEGG